MWWTAQIFPGNIAVKRLVDLNTSASLCASPSPFPPPQNYRTSLQFFPSSFLCVFLSISFSFKMYQTRVMPWISSAFYLSLLHQNDLKIWPFFLLFFFPASSHPSSGREHQECCGHQSSIKRLDIHFFSLQYIKSSRSKLKYMPECITYIIFCVCMHTSCKCVCIYLCVRVYVVCVSAFVYVIISSKTRYHRQ